MVKNIIKSLVIFICSMFVGCRTTLAGNGKVFMKDWIESTKADENSSAQNSTTAQLLTSASLSSQRRPANTMLGTVIFSPS
jgi:hypothetical protein